MHDQNKEKTAQNIATLAEEMGNDVPTMDDFFGDQKPKEQEANTSITN